ncbi:UNVERIFIED_CONTAM: hypothetical protein FKN15_064894 [Acipenser sinensis]
MTTSLGGLGTAHFRSELCCSHFITNVPNHTECRPNPLDQRLSNWGVKQDCAKSAEKLSKFIMCVNSAEKDVTRSRIHRLKSLHSRTASQEALGDSDMPGVLKQILPMIKSKRERTDDDHSPEDLLVLLVYVYSLPGEVVLSKQLEEAELEVKKALELVVCNEPELSSLLQKITDESWAL